MAEQYKTLVDQAQTLTQLRRVHLRAVNDPALGQDALETVKTWIQEKCNN